jgi:hypothetical protein
MGGTCVFARIGTATGADGRLGAEAVGGAATELGGGGVSVGADTETAAAIVAEALSTVRSEGVGFELRSNKNDRTLVATASATMPPIQIRPRPPAPRGGGDP